MLSVAERLSYVGESLRDSLKPRGVLSDTFGLSFSSQKELHS